MAVDLKNRKVSRFRTHLDPMIGPMPKNAFDAEAMRLECELTAAGVYVRLLNGEEHIVPFSNVQSLKLAPVEKTPGKTDKE